MGYAVAMGACICCKQVFTFNPHTVPSTSAVTGSREPICRDCIMAVNEKRKVAGMEPLTWHVTAYEPIDETEL